MAETVEDVIEGQEVTSAKEIYAWLSQFQGSDIRIALKRQHPKTHKGFPCGGTIDHFGQPVNEEEIADLHGGGKFQIVVHRPNPRHGTDKGAPPLIYAGAQTFEIAGPPKLDNIQGYQEYIRDQGGGNGEQRESTSAVEFAMNMANEGRRDALDRADRLENNRGGGMDPEMLETIVGPLRDQNAAYQAQIAELIGKEPDRKGEDRLFDVLGTKEVSHSNAIQSIRTEHDSELRQVRDFHLEDLRRRDERIERQLDDMRRSHDREIAAMQRSGDQSTDTLRSSYEMRIQSLDFEIKRLDRELKEAKTETATLRAKKEVGPVDQLQSLVAIKEGFDKLSPPPEPEEATPGWQRVLETVGGPVIEKLFKGGGEAPQALPPAMMNVQGPDGKIHQVPVEMVQRAQAAKAAGVDIEDAELEEPEIHLDPEDVQKAVSFIEIAYGNGTPPEILGQTVRASGLMPPALLAYLKTNGVDHFMDNVAQIQDSSRLATIDGRMYLRAVVQFLLNGTTDVPEEPTEAATQAPETSEEEVESPEVDEVDIDEPEPEPDSPVE